MAEFIELGALNAVVARTLNDLAHANTIILPVVKVRLQIAPGIADGLGISGADFTLLVSNVPITTGKTDPQGEVQIPLALFATGQVILRTLGTDYVVSLRFFSAGTLSSNDTVGGQQQRLEVAGYLTGYLLGDFEAGVSGRKNPADTDPAHTLDDPTYQMAILNFQADSKLPIVGDAAVKPLFLPLVGQKTRAALRKAAKE